MAVGSLIRKKDWTLTPEAFETLLAQLGGNPDLAGEKYEAVRSKLVKFFGWWGSQFPEDDADETIDRVIRRISEGEEIASLDGYFMGVARLVFRERVKDQHKIRGMMNQTPAQQAPVEGQIEKEETRYECYERCLADLPAESRELVVKYYQEAEGRQKASRREELSAQLGVPLNVLRTRAFRIRKRLGECLHECLKQRSS